jgi:hypothetical protein
VFSELRVDGVLRSPEVHRGLFAWIIGTTDVVSDMGQRGARAAGDENAVT